MGTRTEKLSKSVRFPIVKQTKSLAVILRQEFGVPFAFYDAANGFPILDVEPDGSIAGASDCDRETIRQLAAKNQPRVTVLEGGGYQLAMPISDAKQPLLVGVGVLDALAHSPSERALEMIRLEKWMQSVAERLHHQGQRINRQPGQGGHAAQSVNAWQSLLKLDKLLRRLRIHKDPAKYRQRILDAAAELLPVQTLVWVSQHGEEPVIGGQPTLSPWDCQQLATQLAKSPDWDDAGVLVCNDVQLESWAGRCKNVTNLLAITVADQRMNGLVIALNKVVSSADRAKASRGDQSSESDAATEVRASHPIETTLFRSSDVAVITPFLSLLGLYTSAAQRYHNLKELMVGLARALTSTIDAKDQYTFGHSERVARIAVELGIELGLVDDQLNDIYLTGLLHDIGKIGVPDAVLGKTGPLTPEEMDQVKQHVIIGHKILSDLRPISHLLPGVLYHHERYDGAGYPEGLKGDAIPMLARIIAVADSYDAMSSSRPYRPGMPLERVDEILLQGAGTQWDKNVIEAFGRCRQRLHAIRQRGIGESLRCALDGVIRENDRSEPLSSVATVVKS